MKTSSSLGIIAYVFALAATGNSAQADDDDVKAVFTSTNEAAGNVVVMYERASNGTLTLVDEFPTGGLGTGMGLGNQGAVVLSRNSEWLLVVNAGSNDISVFAVDGDDDDDSEGEGEALELTDVEPSGGMMPVSVTIRGDLVYVLNAAGPGNITGFVLDCDGDLSPLAGSTRPLSGAAVTAPAQVEFSPNGRLLVVTEKMTNLIDTYRVNQQGFATGPNVQDSSGETPFGFGFSRNRRLIVSEAFGGAPDQSAVSSYEVENDGDLDVISASVPTTETAACWIAITGNGRFAYTTNTGSGTITGYRVANNSGALTILDADGVTAETGAGSAPTDLALSGNSRFLYALNSGTGEIDVFRVNQHNGRLTAVQSVGGLPMNGTGLAAR